MRARGMIYVSEHIKQPYRILGLRIGNHESIN